MITYTWEQFDKDTDILAREIKRIPNMRAIYGVPRGGLILAVVLSHKTGLPIELNKLRISKRVLIVDDIADSGKTLERLLNYPDQFNIFTLFKAQNSKVEPLVYCNEKVNDEWILFPWENKESSKYDRTI